MSQLQTIASQAITETPVDLAAGLADGTYAAQARDMPLLWSAATAAPTSVHAYQRENTGNFFWFVVGSEAPPCWVRLESAGTATVARARVIEGRVFIRQHVVTQTVTTTPEDVLDGLPNAEYSVRMRAGPGYWASSATAPTALLDYFVVREDGLLTFCADSQTTVTLWVRSQAGSAQAVVSRHFSAGP